MADSGEYQELMTKYSNLLAELEVKNQALYDCERQKKTAEASVEYCQEEIRNLQNDDASKSKNLEAKIQQLEETNLSLRNSHSTQVIYLEGVVTKKQEEIDHLKRELDDIKTASPDKQPAEDEKLLKEICELQKQNEGLSEQLEEIKEFCDAKNRENTDLQENIIQLKNDLENYKEILSCKTFELDEANSLIQTLKDDYMCLKSELDLMKSKPLDDASRGNSLFAEVDDRRVKLQENMVTMKTKFLEMKRERGSLLKQIGVLRTENRALLARWQAEVVEAKQDDEMILESYKDQIQTLKDLVESYKNQLVEKNANSYGSSECVVKFFDKMLQTKNEEIEAMRQKLAAKSLSQNLLSHDLADARKENRKCKLDILKLQSDIVQLKTEMDEIKWVKTLPEPEKKIEATPIKEEIINLDESELDEFNKENNADKKVQFSENTVEPRVTDRSKFRKGVKILESKPIYVPSVSKKSNI